MGRLYVRGSLCEELLGSMLVGVEHVGNRICGEQVESVQVGGEQAGSMLSINSPAFHSV